MESPGYEIRGTKVLSGGGGGNQGKGRALHTTRPFKPGDLIGVFPPPAAAAPASSSRRTALVLPPAESSADTCAHCLRSALPFSPSPVSAPAASAMVLKRCTGCRSVSYCGAPCQKANWTLVHKEECKVLKRAVASAAGAAGASGAASSAPAASDGLSVPSSCRAVIQVLVKPDIFGAVETELDGNVGAFEKLQKDRWVGFGLQARALLGWVDRGKWGVGEGAGAGAGAEAEGRAMRRIIEILCKIQTNAFSRSDPGPGQTSGGGGGTFVDTTLAMVNHSCVPNAIVSFSGRRAFLRAARELKAGEEVEISYLDSTQPLVQRQKDLEHYHFTCACPRCTDDLDNYQAAALAASPSPSTLDLNAVSLAPASFVSRIETQQAQGAVVTKPADDRGIEESESAAAVESVRKLLYSDPSVPPPSRRQQLRRAYAESPSIRSTGRWANEPNGHFLAAAASYYVSRGNFEAALAVSCLAATEAHPYEHPEAFHPARVQGCMEIVNALTNTAPDPAKLARFAERVFARAAKGDPPASTDELFRSEAGNGSDFLVGTLRDLDHMSLCQMVLFLVLRYAPMGHSTEWPLFLEAKDILEELQGLPGRERENSLVYRWLRNSQDPQMREFFEFAVRKPVGVLSTLGKALLRVDFGLDSDICS